MKLYNLPLSPYCARVRGSIYAKDLPVELLPPPEGWPLEPSLQSLNPFNQVPVLVLDGGAAIWESAVIVDYLEDIFPEPSLRPGFGETVARLRMVAQAADRYILTGASEAVLGYYLSGGTPPARGELAKLAMGLKALDSLLRPGSYVFEGHLTLADTALAPVLFFLDALAGVAERPDLLEPYPAIRAYRQVVEKDPILSRLWGEMADALVDVKAGRL